MDKVPAIILSGFLGSGKTTLLHRMLQETRRRGIQAAVLMNELGKFDVDGFAINEEIPESAMEKLLDGCICCSKKSEVATYTTKLLDRQPDVLFIELTGVANPEEVVECFSEPKLKDRIVLKRIITVLDAEWTLEYNSIFQSDRELVHTLRRQMETADIILINKLDVVPEARLPAIEKAVRKQNPTAVMYPTTHSQAPLDSLLEGIEPLGRTASTAPAAPRLRFQMATAEHRHTDSHKSVKTSFSRVGTLTLVPPPGGVMPEPKDTDKFLKRWSSKLLRAKGYQNNRLIQLAGGRTYTEDSEYNGPPYLVLIGIDLDEPSIRTDWETLASRTSVGK